MSATWLVVFYFSAYGYDNGLNGFRIHLSHDELGTDWKDNTDAEAKEMPTVMSTVQLTQHSVKDKAESAACEGHPDSKNCSGSISHIETQARLLSKVGSVFMQTFLKSDQKFVMKLEEDEKNQLIVYGICFVCGVFVFCWLWRQLVKAVIYSCILVGIAVLCRHYPLYAAISFGSFFALIVIIKTVRYFMGHKEEFATEHFGPEEVPPKEEAETAEAPASGEGSGQ